MTTHRIKCPIEKVIEYNKPLIMLLVEFEKAFDAVQHTSLLKAITERNVDHKYTTLFENIYIIMQQLQIECIMVILFLQTIRQSAIKNNSWGNINVEFLNNLRFADDIQQQYIYMDHAIKLKRDIQTCTKRVRP